MEEKLIHDALSVQQVLDALETGNRITPEQGSR